MVGCQSSQEKAATQTKGIELATTYLVNDEIDFQVVKSEVSNQISPTNKNQTYKHINAPENYIFMDVVFKTSNKTS
ncbi:MAG: hypothetical protein RR585_13110, partial [Coprobacillus sp.]